MNETLQIRSMSNVCTSYEQNDFFFLKESDEQIEKNKQNKNKIKIHKQEYTIQMLLNQPQKSV